MRLRNALPFVIVFLGALALSQILAASCALTPRGSAQQAGLALVAIGEQALTICEQSKAQNWQGLLNKEQCRLAHLSYKEAEAAWEVALAASKADKPTGTILLPVLRFILTQTDVLIALGVELEPEAKAYLSNVKRGL